ncbi:hypothetical protein [Gaiella sp.]|uniref:hypothetical protein n=1 Tax=Gaiella sp. TaxID=2663207 RepID=UPI003263C55C
MAVVDRLAEQPTVYNVVLLAGSPRRYSLSLAPGISAGALIEVDGEEWTVADVRDVDGRAPQLICIYAV